jgi:uncharacterized cupredoxin-like copper-binding protein
MRHLRTWPAALSLLALLFLALLAVGYASGASTARRVEIHIRYSHFEPSEVTVPRGVAVTVVLINDDPIDHEWLIGDAAFHDRHRRGTETQHGARPNEISIPAMSTVETTLAFAETGKVQYICHIPGHEAYGMVGTLTVE